MSCGLIFRGFHVLEIEFFQLNLLHLYPCCHYTPLYYILSIIYTIHYTIYIAEKTGCHGMPKNFTWWICLYSIHSENAEYSFYSSFLGPLLDHVLINCVSKGRALHRVTNPISTGEVGAVFQLQPSKWLRTPKQNKLSP